MTDKITESLQKSSQKIAKQIALMMKERQELEKELNGQENEITMLEASVEVHREQRDHFHGELKTKKSSKQGMYDNREGLIRQKRDLQTLFNETNREDTSLSSRIDAISDEIGTSIETSKALQEQMNEYYEKGNVEHEAMLATIKVLKEKRYYNEERSIVLEKKLSEIDKELNLMRRKMKSISENLNRGTKSQN